MTDAERDDALAVLLGWMDWPLSDVVYIELPSGRFCDLSDSCSLLNEPHRSDLISLRGLGFRTSFRVSEIVDSLKDDKRPLPVGLAEHGIRLASICPNGRGQIITYHLLWYLEFTTCGLDSDEAERRWELGRQDMKRRLAARET